jgi:flagellar basal body rod protein FlgC
MCGNAANRWPPAALIPKGENGAQASCRSTVQANVTIRPLMQSGIAGMSAESQRFDLSAERLTRLAGAPSAAETAETVQISAEARKASQTRDNAESAGLERAMVDMRVAKYAFIANLEVLETGAEVEKAASELGK